MAFVCRRCHTSLAGVPSTQAPTLPAEETNTYVPEVAVRICPACGWRTAEESPAHDIDLATILEEFPDARERLTDTTDRADASRILRDVRAGLVAQLEREVLADPWAAFHFLESTLQELYELDRDVSFSGQPVKLAQQIYLHIIGRDALPVMAHPPDGPPPPFWQQPVIKLMIICAALCEWLREIRLGLVARISGGRLSGAVGADALWSAEVNANLTAGPPADGVTETFRDPLLVQAERRAFGCSAADLVDVLEDSERRNAATRWMVRGELLILDMTAPELGFAQMASAFTLIRERLLTREFPSLFAAAGEPVERSWTDVLQTAAEADWLLCAPLMRGFYVEEGERRPALLTSGYLLHRMQGSGGVHVAYRMHNAVEAARRRPGGTAGAVSFLAQSFHAQFERAVGDSFARGGMSVTTNLERLGGRPLPCGEIDVVATAAAPGRRTIVAVCEAKNTDVSFYKDLGVAQAQDMIQRAARQATAKARWMLERWRDVAPVLGCDRDPAPLVVALVVTRHTVMPLGDAPGPAVIPAQAVPALADALRTGSPADWRPDLAASVLDGGAA